MAKGIIFDRFMYPASIKLDQGDSFSINVNDEVYKVIIKDHINATIVFDFENNINVKYKYGIPYTAYLDREIGQINQDTPYIFEIGNEVVKVIDYTGDKSILYTKVFTKEPFTDILVAYQVNDISEALNQDNQNSIKALNYFLEHYKDTAKQANIKDIGEIIDRDVIYYRGLYKYKNEDKGKNFEEVLEADYCDIEDMMPAGFKTKMTALTTSTRSVEEIRNVLEDRFLKNIPIGDTQLLLNRAAGELYSNDNPKYAFLDIFIALESFITEILNKYKKEVVKISKTKINEYKKNLTISYVLDIELRIIFNNDFEDNENELFTKVKGLAKKRNKIVHEKKDVTFKEAEEALHYAEDFIGIIKTKFDKKFFNKE
ncbi:hypothetical protein [Alteribacillus sp. HJP-4]|uniref:hypothetical protein n=1 Tax=Alteribacillus sp. HJP-4 TaxID=2775394 RepID=UPI0035CD37EE